MLEVVDWQRLNSGRLGKVRRSRLERRQDPMAPVALDGVCIDTAPSPAFLAFVVELRRRPRDAETWVSRVMQWTGLNAAQDGVIRVARADFGAVVLTRAWDRVSASHGEEVYDALVASGLCVATGGDTGGDAERFRGSRRGLARACAIAGAIAGAPRRLRA